MIKGDFLGRHPHFIFFGGGRANPHLIKGSFFWEGTHHLAIARYLFVGGILAIYPHIPIIYIRVSHTTRTLPHGLPQHLVGTRAYKTPPTPRGLSCRQYSVPYRITGYHTHNTPPSLAGLGGKQCRNRLTEMGRKRAAKENNESEICDFLCRKSPR